jgi:hypothetical protein
MWGLAFVSYTPVPDKKEDFLIKDSQPLNVVHNMGNIWDVSLGLDTLILKHFTL